MSGPSQEIFTLLGFSLTMGILFSRTFLALLESWKEEPQTRRPRGSRHR
jgi:hypothetical protein